MSDSEKIVPNRDIPRFYSNLAEVYYDQAIRCHQNQISFACIAMCWAAIDYAVEHELKGGAKLSPKTLLPRQAIQFNPRDIPAKLKKLWLLFPALQKWDDDLLLLYGCFRNTFLHGKLDNVSESMGQAPEGLSAIALKSRGRESIIAYTSRLSSVLWDIEQASVFESTDKETLLIGAVVNVSTQAVEIMGDFLKELGDEISRTNIPTKKEIDQMLFKEWDGWLSTIYTDLQQTFVNRYVFRETMAVVEANLKIQIDDTFYGWMRMVYSQSTVMAVRRQVDKRKDVASFARLLEQIKEFPAVVSRERYVALYVGSVVPEYIAHRHFDEYSGSEQPYISVEMVNGDLEKLKRLASSVAKFSHKRVAHYDHKEFHATPTWKELDDCLDFLEVLLKKYLGIFRAEAHLHIVPVWQYNWKEIFTMPWINQKLIKYDL